MDARFFYKSLQCIHKLAVTFIITLFLIPLTYSYNTTAILNTTQTNPPPNVLPYVANNTLLINSEINSLPNLIPYTRNTSTLSVTQTNPPPSINSYPWRNSTISDISSKLPPSLIPYPKKNGNVFRKVYGYVFHIENISLTNGTLLALIGNFQFVNQVFLNRSPPLFFNSSSNIIDLNLNGIILPSKIYYLLNLNQTINTTNTKAIICVNFTPNTIYCRAVSLNSVADVYIIYPKVIPVGSIGTVLIILKPKVNLNDIQISLKSSCPAEIFAYKSNIESKYIGYITYIPRMKVGKYIYVYYYVIPTYNLERCLFFVSLYQYRYFLGTFNTTTYYTTGGGVVYEHSISVLENVIFPVVLLTICAVLLLI